MDATTAADRAAPDSPLRVPDSPPRAAGGGGLVDPASFLRIALDPALKELTPLHWAFEYLQAVRAGDTEFVAVAVRSATRGFTVGLVTEPLGPARQNLLHVAALLNQPAIVAELLFVADRYAAVEAEAARLRVREAALAARGKEASPVAYQTRLGAELDKVDRVRGRGRRRGEEGLR